MSIAAFISEIRLQKSESSAGAHSVRPSIHVQSSTSLIPCRDDHWSSVLYNVYAQQQRTAKGGPYNRFVKLYGCLRTLGKHPCTALCFLISAH